MVASFIVCSQEMELIPSYYEANWIGDDSDANDRMVRYTLKKGIALSDMVFLGIFPVR